MAELVDALDSKSGYRKVVQVRFLFWAPNCKKELYESMALFLCPAECTLLMSSSHAVAEKSECSPRVSRAADPAVKTKNISYSTSPVEDYLRACVLKRLLFIFDAWEFKRRVSCARPCDEPSTLYATACDDEMRNTSCGERKGQVYVPG
jgi:hypothetical protein